MIHANTLRIRTSSAQWDELRVAFHRSLMIDTSLASLAQNIDGCAWPIEGPDEKPSVYIELTYAEVIARIRARGASSASIDDLADILRGTLVFDEAFGEMVEIASKAEEAADPVMRNLAKLGIPADFPVGLCAFGPERQAFCARENILTLADFLGFARAASRHVMVGGEFRDLLNAVAHVDEQTLARHLPFRPKATGLHLVESLGMLLRPLSVEERMALARGPGSISPELRAQVARRLEYFAPQAAVLAAQLAQGAPVSRLVVSLDDLSLEAVVGALLGLHLAPASPGESSVPEPGRGRRGFWRRLGFSRRR